MTEQVWIVLTHHRGCSGFEVVEGVFTSDAGAQRKRDARWAEIKRGTPDAAARFRVYVVKKKVER